MPADARLPLFPLRTVLFPGGRLPLQIFELRYLDMVLKAHREGTPFGVVCLTEGDEVRRAVDGGDFATEAFHRVGTLARIDHLERPRPGLLMIRCTGLQRFQLGEIGCLPSGLWVGEARTLADDAAVAIPPDLEHTGLALARVIDDLRAQGVDDDALPVQGPWQFDDCGWVANRWSELLPLSTALRQQLLTVDSPLVRLELVSDELERLRGGGPDDD